MFIPVAAIPLGDLDGRLFVTSESLLEGPMLIREVRVPGWGTSFESCMIRFSRNKSESPFLLWAVSPFHDFWWAAVPGLEIIAPVGEIIRVEKTVPEAIVYTVFVRPDTDGNYPPLRFPEPDWKSAHYEDDEWEALS